MSFFNKIFGKQEISNTVELCSPISGQVIKLCDVPDPTFSGEILGKGIAIHPADNTFYAPCDGTIEMIFDTCHAVSIKAANDIEILIHIGLETVELNGKYYTSHVKNGQKIKKGDKLITFDKTAVSDAGYNTVTPMVICNSDEFNITEIKLGEVKNGEPVLSVNKI